jgi:hypothetical protein
MGLKSLNIFSPPEQRRAAGGHEIVGRGQGRDRKHCCSVGQNTCSIPSSPTAPVSHSALRALTPQWRWRLHDLASPAFFRAGTRQCEVVHLSTQPGFDSLPVCYLQTDGLLGIEHMKQFIALFVAAIVLVVLPTIASADCPKGYVPCGERSQLCCPGK